MHTETYTETHTELAMPSVVTTEIVETSAIPPIIITPGYTTALPYNPMTPFAPYLSSETITSSCPEIACKTIMYPQPGEVSVVSEVLPISYPYVIDSTVSKPVQETVLGLGGIFTDVSRTLENPVYWVSDSMARQRQRLALVDEQIRQAEMKIQVLRTHATGKSATRADKKLYKHALRDYKKICARRNKVWKTL
jgi:hypothetical protein